jgi:hypothetical protein
VQLDSVQLPGPGAQPPHPQAHQLLAQYQTALHSGPHAATELLRRELSLLGSWQGLAAATEALGPTGLEAVAQLSQAAVQLHTAAPPQQQQAASAAWRTAQQAQLPEHQPLQPEQQQAEQLRQHQAAAAAAAAGLEQHAKRQCLQLLCHATQIGLPRCSNSRALVNCTRNLARLGAASPQLLMQIDERLAILAGQLQRSRDPATLSKAVWGVAKIDSLAAKAAARQQLHQLQQLQQQAPQLPAPGAAAGEAGGGTSSSSSSSNAGGSGSDPLAAADQLQAAAPGQERPSPGFVSAWLRASPLQLASFKPSHLATSVYSLALLRRRPSVNWCTAFLAASEPQLHAASGQDLGNMLWALARLGVEPPGSWMAAFEAAARRINSTLPAPAVAQIVWALGRLGLQPSTVWRTDLMFQSQRTITKADGRSLVALADGWVALGVVPAAEWVRRYCKAAAEQLTSRPTPRAFAGILWGLARLGWRPSAAWVTAATRGVQPQLARFKPRDFSQVGGTAGPAGPWEGSAAAGLAASSSAPAGLVPGHCGRSCDHCRGAAVAGRRL